MATKERSTRETGACVRDCQSYRVKPVVFQRTQLLFSILLVGLTGCTSVVTAPIDVASSVVGAGFHMVGAVGGAVVDTVTGGGSTNEAED